MGRNNIGFESRGGERSSLNMAVERAKTEVGHDEEHSSRADPSPPERSNTRMATMDELTVQQGAGGHADEAARRRGRGHKDRAEKARREGQDARRDGRALGEPRQDGRDLGSGDGGSALRSERTDGRDLSADPSGINQGLRDDAPDAGAGSTRRSDIGTLRSADDGAGSTSDSVLGNLLDVARNAGDGAGDTEARKGGPPEIRDTSGTGGLVSRLLGGMF